ncbi:ABC transporter ATP-binding protein [Salinispora vitiensis]|uniref:ABC transporter ATP-binding protein n=1 Tax=Salinispora vitiensis TaxID=999544 RepID=UPI00036B7B10|nr:ABC transporter ATP-binding protein [Salinispora vitiensis]
MDIEITDLTKTFKGDARALDQLSLSLAPGMIGLLGANGAGKTTLMRIITGLISPTSGRVIVGGHDVATGPGRQAVRRVLGYLPQDLDLYPDLNAREFLDYVALLKGIDDKRVRRSQVGSLLERVALTEHANRRVRGFSGGMRRRLGIAQALLGDPKLIIVDEPTAGLDPEERMRFRTLLAGLGGDRTVILSTHILDDVAQTCPAVAVLNAGRLAYHGSTNGLVEAADGRTFSLHTTGAPPAGDLTVVNAQAASGGMLYRFVTETPPVGAEAVAPSLEDGYVALMRTSRARPQEVARDRR